MASSSSSLHTIMMAPCAGAGNIQSSTILFAGRRPMRSSPASAKMAASQFSSPSFFQPGIDISPEIVDLVPGIFMQPLRFAADTAGGDMGCIILLFQEITAIFQYEQVMDNASF